MGIESFFRKKSVPEKSAAQAEHDKKTTREAGMIGIAAVAAAAGAGATYENIPNLESDPHGVGKTVEAPARANDSLMGGVTIEKTTDGKTIINVPAEKGPAEQKRIAVEMNEQPVHIKLEEQQVHVDNIEH
ncbi:MAG: hypothetical protein AAB472_02440 [Patescibacteria group bacterium]